MRVPYDWLKSYVDVKMKPEKLAELLTMAGHAVESIEKRGEDYIFEVDITSNRPDCLSMIGIAREVGALTGQRLKVPYSVQRTAYSERRRTPYAERSTISIKVEDKKLCPRYTAKVIRDVKIGESPKWLKERIEAIGLRPVNNVVDITNFCLFETGEPMHAFDLDKVSGRVIIVRRARKGERIITIDGIERILADSDLIIADRDKPIAIAGVIGGLNTEVTPSTKNILLEAAFFDPVSVRRTSRRLGISTESSYRFERRVSLEKIPYSSNRLASLILEVAGGRTGEFFDIGKKAQEKRMLIFRYSRLDNVLGLEISPPKVKRILGSLGLESKAVSNGIKVKVPHFRPDLQDEIDIVEDVARLYGYDKISETIPKIIEQAAERTPFNMVVEKRIRGILTGLGCDEIITYGLLSRRVSSACGISEKDMVEIANPLSSDEDVMRPSLISGILNTIAWNMNRKNKDLKLFELGNIYIKGPGGKFREGKTLSIGLTGCTYSNWACGSRDLNFFDLKGVVETLLSELGVGAFSWRETKDERFSLGAAASIEVEDRSIGIMGALDNKVLDGFDIEDEVYASEICVDSLLRYVKLEKGFKELPKYPAVFRDISIIVGKEIKNSDLASVIKNAAGPVLRDVELIDRYVGRQIPDGKTSLTYRLEYQDLKKTLEEKEVSAVHSKVLQSLEGKFGAILR